MGDGRTNGCVRPRRSRVAGAERVRLGRSDASFFVEGIWVILGPAPQEVEESVVSVWDEA